MGEGAAHWACTGYEICKNTLNHQTIEKEAVQHRMEKHGTSIILHYGMIMCSLWVLGTTQFIRVGTTLLHFIATHAQRQPIFLIPDKLAQRVKVCFGHLRRR